MAYKPIESYGVIGDLHTVALVNMDGVVRSVRGAVRFRLECQPAFDYARRRSATRVRS
jgi:hypothetical protein